MKRRHGIILPLGALILATIVVTLATSFASMLLFPPPPPPMATTDQVAAALREDGAGEDRDVWSRTIVAEKPNIGQDTNGSDILSQSLANSLGISAADVTLVLSRRSAGPAADTTRAAVTVVRVGGSKSTSVESSSVLAAALAPTLRNVPIPVTSAALRQPDGRWVVVEPRVSLFSPWHRRILASFALAAFILVPPALWTVRRITKPLRRLALAAEHVDALDTDQSLLVEGPAEVESLAQTLNSLIKRVATQVRERGVTLAAIAHDLRTPLTAMRVRAEDCDDETRLFLINDIVRMETLISQVLAFIRSEHPVQFTRVDLAQRAVAIVDQLRGQGQPVTAHCDAGIVVMGDAIGLDRLISNLLDNALRYGGAATLSLTRQGSTCLLVVADDGPGIPSHELFRVIEPFHRLDNSRSADGGGTGLGLPIAQQVAVAHGGRLDLANSDDGGLRVSVSLPLAERDLPQAPTVGRSAF